MFIFIVGAPRSGTKFLRNTLMLNSDICIMPEIHFFSSIIHKGVIVSTKKICPFDNDEKLLELKNILKSGDIFGSWWKYCNDINYEKVINEFKFTNRTYRELFKCILEEYAAENRCKIVGERTPANIFHVNKLIKWFPDAKILHIIRNPFSVIASELNMFKKLGYPLKKDNIFYKPILFTIVLLRWYIIYRLNYYYLRKYPQNYMLIKYEELFLNKKSTLSQIGNFLNIEFPENIEDVKIENSSFRKDEDDSISYNPLISWKKSLGKPYKFLISVFLFIPIRKMKFFNE